MNKEQQQKAFIEMTERMFEIMMSKGDDYAGSDRLSNFKKVAMMSNVSTEIGIHIQVSNKVVRLGELLSGKSPKHESIEDSIIDCANYLLLMAMVIKERQPEKIKI
jgi:hypothetical protein